jgi:hypothetical protein
LLRISEWLTYTSMEQLRQLNQTYFGEEPQTHSKYDLIRALLPRLADKQSYHTQLTDLNTEQLRFLQLLLFDPTLSFTMEELLAKGRAALGDKSGEPRRFIVDALKRGWLFQGYSQQTRYLYYVPSDLRKQLLHCLLEPYHDEVMIRPPRYYRDEEGQMIRDLKQFLTFLREQIVRVTESGCIQLLETFVVPEQPIEGKGPRFGFGRSYHLYPDRFALLYDYCYFENYIIEDSEGYLRLREQDFGYIFHTDEKQLLSQLYRFWVRLYKRPIPQLPIILKWIGSLANMGWFPVATVKEVVFPWLKPFYYETETTLFYRLLQMLGHLGVLRIGEESTGEQWISLTPTGVAIFADISAFQEKVINEAFFYGRE